MLVTDDLTGRLVYVAENRVSRPDTSDANCPFCPGGRESLNATGPYAFPNRWPPVEHGRCEVIVYGPDHNRDLARLSPIEVRDVVDIWTDRSTMQWRMPDTHCVLVFENRGPEAGATIAHPHGQLFGLPFVPPLCSAPATGACLACRDTDPELLIEVVGDWAVTVPPASPSPYSLRLIPARHVSRLDQLAPTERSGLAAALGCAVRRLDALFSRPMPYHLWIPQLNIGHLTVTIEGLLRDATRLRVIGAAEMATGVSFSPLSPQRAAAALRASPGTAG